ncbi:MAG: hypothetical protein Q4A79_02690 [Candidatus Saccharibacteria bacterium]|nr:hypothetical protein [Candidatus Saccharibacteria bacterium]
MDEGLAKIRHARSMKDFPFLRLEDDEYVEYAFGRAAIRLILIIGAIELSLVGILLIFLAVLEGQSKIDAMGMNFMFITLAALVLTVFVIGAATIRVHRKNRLFVTNKHVIQIEMKSLLSSSCNMIDLGSIEDVSFSQKGLMEKLFHYGTLRLSTIGDETTYTFPYSDILPSELKAISNMITEAKKELKRKQAGE